MSVIPKFRNLNEEFDHFLNSIVQETKDTDLTEKKKNARRRLADQDEFQFCKIYFPGIFTDEFNAIHRHIRSLQTGNHTVAGCRLFGKSAYTYTAKLVRYIAQSRPGLIGIAMRTQPDAIERTASIKRLIDRNKLLRYDYGINIQQDKKGFYIINNVTMVGVGVQEGLRNFIDDDYKRFRLFIMDDLFNRVTVTSELDNNKVYNFVTSEAWGQMEPDGLSIWLYNYITQESPGSKIAQEYPAQHFNLPALNDQEQTNWPESTVRTTEYLHKLRDTLPWEVWMGDYMNQPVLKGEVFNPDWIKTVSLTTVQLSAVIAVIDPSFGQSPSACSKGCAIVGITADLRYILLGIYIRKEDYEFLFDWIADQITLYNGVFKAVLFENDFNQWAFAAPYYQQWQQRTKQHLPLIEFNSKDSKTEFYGSDKTSRIMNLVHPYQTGRFLHADTIPDGSDKKQWFQQFISFGKSKTKLDGLDAQASAFIKILQYIQSGTFKSTGTRPSSVEGNSWLENR